MEIRCKDLTCETILGVFSSPYCLGCQQRRRHYRPIHMVYGVTDAETVCGLPSDGLLGTVGVTETTDCADCLAAHAAHAETGTLEWQRLDPVVDGLVAAVDRLADLLPTLDAETAQHGAVADALRSLRRGLDAVDGAYHTLRVENL